MGRKSASQLESFLFGAERLGAVRLRLALLEVQDHRCFYTGRHLAEAGDAQVDHFLPWARYPTDAVENLVVASQAANAAKSAHLAAAVHLARWRSHVDVNADLLREVADANRWPSQAGATLSVARAIYLRVRSGADLWRDGKSFEGADPTEIRLALAG